MKILITLLFICLCISNLIAQRLNFAVTDSLITRNLQSAFSGNTTCLVWQNGSIVYYRQEGNIDSNSIIPVASVSKTFAGMLVLSMAQDALFDLNDSIGRFLPVFTQYGKGSSTIAQCFSHTGGWPDSSEYITMNRIRLAQAADSIARNTETIYNAGQGFYYGGVSMHIVGRVAEVASGGLSSYTQLFSQRVATPLGLRNTFYCVGGTNPRIAGGVCTSASDMLKLGKMITNNGRLNNVQIIQPAYNEWFWKDVSEGVTQIYSPVPRNNTLNNPFQASQVGYGIGVWEDVYNPSINKQEQISAAGAFGTFMWMDRCRNLVGIIMAKTSYQTTRETAWQIMDNLRSQIPSSCEVNAISANKKTGGYLLTKYDQNLKSFQIQSSDQTTPIEIYSLLGVKLAKCEFNNSINITLPPAIYLVKQGNVTSNVIVE